MNKFKGVLVLVFIFVISIPSFGNEYMIVRKKNKWISAVEQQVTDQTVRSGL